MTTPPGVDHPGVRRGRKHRRNDVAGDSVTTEGAAPSAVIPAVMVSQNDGALIKLTLLGTGTVAAAP
jgi:hypothetical protein